MSRLQNLVDQDGSDPVIHPRDHRALNVVSGIVIAGLTVAIARSMITNEGFQWSVVGEYFFSTPILDGLWTTLVLTFICMIVASLLGTAVAVMRLSSSVVLRGAAWLYIWFFRAIPILVLLIVLYNFAALYPVIEVSIPFGPTLWSADTNSIMTAAMASILGLALHEAASMAEIVRSGIISVDRGQLEAADALGLTPRQRFRRVILPQAMQIIIPPSSTQLLNLLKMTTLVSVLAMGDLLFSAQMIYTRTFQPIPLLIVASLWYLILTSILMLVQQRLEKRMGSSEVRI